MSARVEEGAHAAATPRLRALAQLAERQRASHGGACVAIRVDPWIEDGVAQVRQQIDEEDQDATARVTPWMIG